MQAKTRKYITYFMPGSFMPETKTVAVESFDIPKTIPRDVYMFQFHETEFVIGDDGKEYKGETKTDPKLHYIGRIVHANDIPNTPENRILISNVRSNSPVQEGIKTHLGNWQFVDENSVVHSTHEFTFSAPIIWDNIKSEAA